MGRWDDGHGARLAVGVESRPAGRNDAIVVDVTHLFICSSNAMMQINLFCRRKEGDCRTGYCRCGGGSQPKGGGVRRLFKLTFMVPLTCTTAQLVSTQPTCVGVMRAHFSWELWGRGRVHCSRSGSRPN